MAVTAYNTGYAAGNDDPATIINENQTNGNESWYTYGPGALDANTLTPTVSSVSPNRGPENQTAAVTISGTNFFAGATVTFGSTAATSVVVVNATTIDCTAPASSAGTVNVVVTNAGNKSGTLSNGFTYFGPPSITSAATASGTVGLAFSYQIAASNSPTGYNATNLPSWAIVDTGSGGITGTPDATGDTNATINASNEAGTGTGPLRISIGNPVPSISSISPSSKTAGDAAFTLTVNGSNYVSSSVIRWGGTDKTTTFVSSAQLTCPMAAADVAAAGTVNVTVFSPTPGGGETGAAAFTVNNPAPSITSLGPNSKTAGDAAFTLTANGSNFVSSSVIRWGGTNKTTTFVSSAQLTCPIAAADVATSGTVNVTVYNPTPGGGQSSPATFTINNPAPVLTGISPTSATAGAASFTLTLNGSGFVASSVVKWSGQADLSPATHNATQITVNVPASYIAAAGTPSVSVFNRTPGGGTSLSQSFTINNPAPGITSLSPSSAIVGGASFTLTVNGSGFVNGSAIWWGNSGKATTFVSASQLTAPIAAGDIGAVGAVNVTVVTPSPGGGTSGASVFSVNPPAPAITSATSASGTAGVAFSYQITASNSPTSYNAASLPSWASVDKGTGAIVGTPDATGSTNVAISATNVSGTSSATLQITIASAVPSITSPLTATGTVGQSFSYTITATGATPMTFSAQPLPDGLSLSGATISGTPWNITRSFFATAPACS